jgi:hypothetical protein
MTNTQDSAVKQRIEELKAGEYMPENNQELYNELLIALEDKQASLEALKKFSHQWQDELIESYQCVDKLQVTINQYENDLVMMMDQMDALVKCSLLIKQYSLYLKDEIDKVADKIDKEGFDERLDQLVNLLDDIKPKKHLNLVRQADVLKFPKKPEK